jgi:hypothetical protein
MLWQATAALPALAPRAAAVGQLLAAAAELVVQPAAGMLLLSPAADLQQISNISWSNIQ